MANSHAKGKKKKLVVRVSSFRRLLLILAFLAVTPPIFFHFRLRRFQQMRLKKCTWVKNPPLVCAHGGDPTNAFPNTMSAYRAALVSKVDCIEIDVSRSSDGVLFALHDRFSYIAFSPPPLDSHLTQSGICSACLIKEIDRSHLFPTEFRDQQIPTVEDALVLVSKSVRQVILDAKVGPPNYEKGLATDILSVVERTRCTNCLVWAKSDTLARDVIKLTAEIPVGYIVLKDSSTGTRTNLLRIKAAEVVGVYHPLINESLVKILRGRKKKVYAWTVDEEDSMLEMLFQCVDAIVTSHPALLQRQMQYIRTECLEEGFSLL
ncbi:hypothetical protein IFM89_039645 [Coptis chinensis]|uniref:glycerophosphodiester phosphodiesterase n=1 Tax=Coptis chinensis TaxID=261450 RepID=A0A835GXQ0_9MAGN|nr:hypothetical protein IFM89_039645 [Coptis chinensis]